MTRRADPTRIDTARRDATRQRLLGTGMLPERADALMAAWQAEATRQGLPADHRYADEAAWVWITSQPR
jgi:hypothetical protein